MCYLISIIIPVYNVKEYLIKCLNSVITQTYQNLEIIIVDDGSMDGSDIICDDFQEMDHRIIVIHQENKGLSAARNAGLDMASGDYILFVDSDDYIDSEMVEKLINVIDKNDMAMCGFYKTDDKTIYEDSQRIKEDIWNMDTFWKYYYKNKRTECVVVWNKLYKAELFRDIRFAEEKINEDEFLINHLMNGDRTISICHENLYFYVQRPGSIMTRKRSINYFEALMERVKIFIKNGKQALARRTILYALYVLNTYGYENEEYWKKEFYKISKKVKTTPIFTIKLMRRIFRR